MKEEILALGKRTTAKGILTKGQGNTVAVILLNAGMIHKVGPNRLYVKTARHLAGIGVTCFRFDFSGLGDREQSRDHDDHQLLKVKEVTQAMDAVAARTGIQKFVLLGICSGAEIAFQVSLVDTRVVGLSLIDGVYTNKESLKHIYPLAIRRTAMRYYRKHLFSAKRWLKLLRGKSNFFNREKVLRILQACAGLLRRRQAMQKAGNEQAALPAIMPVDIGDWEKLFHRRVQIHLIFCEGGIAVEVFNMTLAPLLKSFKKMLTHTFIRDVDHTFTPPWSQHDLMNTVSGWMADKFVLQSTKQPATSGQVEVLEEAY